MLIFYGNEHNNINVTDICLSKLLNNNIITIHNSECHRVEYFTDPLPGVLKKIFILNNNKMTVYEYYYVIKINIINFEITTVSDYEINYNLLNIHSKLKIKYGYFNEELPEQGMVVRSLKGNEKVLEIGGNIGRNTLVIAHILGENNNNFVTLECNEDIAKQLTENKLLNNFIFNIEQSALSNRKLIQQNWYTKPSETLENEYNWVNTITFNELKTKYNIEFDTLVLDCEGAFYYILMDMPEILNNINLIIMENDYNDISHKIYIDDILIKNNFYRDYVESGGWEPCYINFYEVWKKIIL